MYRVMTDFGGFTIINVTFNFTNHVVVALVSRYGIEHICRPSLLCSLVNQTTFLGV